MSNLEYIDDYFRGSKSKEQKDAFEKRIVDDVSFAEDVAMYISVNQQAKQHAAYEKKQWFREIYDDQKVSNIQSAPAWKPWQYLAAASVIGISAIIYFFFFLGKGSSKQMADRYVTQNWQTLGVTMGNANDNLQKGLDLYNAGNVNEAIAAFKTALKEDNTNTYALKYAGIAFYKSAQYDSAMVYFNTLASDTALHSNPGKLYTAVTLLKRDKPGDKEAAKDLLQQIVKDDLEGKQEAVEWLEKWK